MGRKKKKIEKEEKKSSKKFELGSNIKAKLLSSELVQGNVKLTLLTKGSNKVVRTLEGNNTGTINVCEYLRDALAGDYVINQRPGIIIPCAVQGGKLVNLTNGVPYLGNAMKNDFDVTDVGCSMTLMFLIGSELAGSEIGGFRLCSLDSADLPNAEKRVYAEINLVKQYGEEEGIVIVTPGTNLKVEWTVSVRFK